MKDLQVYQHVFPRLLFRPLWIQFERSKHFQLCIARKAVCVGAMKGDEKVSSSGS